MRRLLWIAVAFLLAFDVAHAQAARADPTCTVDSKPVGPSVVVTYNGLRVGRHYLATLFAMDLLDENALPLPLTYPELQTRAFTPAQSTEQVLFGDLGDGRFEGGLLLLKGDGRANQELATHCTAIVE